MPNPGIATAADYSEALLVARRAKNLIALILALMIVGQLTLFLLLHNKIIFLPSGLMIDSIQPGAATQPVPLAVGVAGTENGQRAVDLLHYLTGAMLLSGITLSIVLALVLCLIGHIMLVGRLIGVGRVTGALVLALVLIVLLFPWQAFMNDANLTLTDFRVPGILWTWGELIRRYDFTSALTGEHWADTVLSWFRFVGAPVVALVLVLAIQLKSNRGLRMAMGEDEVLNELLRQQ